MTVRKPDEETIMDRLLTDDEFADLMIAAYEEAGSPVDELGKRRVWQGLAAQLRTGNGSRGFSHKQWAPAVAVALVVLAVVFSPRKTDDLMRVKGTETAVVDLFAYTVNASGQTETAGETLTVGETLVFKYRLREQGTVALIVSENGAVPEVKFISTEGHPGVEQLLVREGRTYGYATSAGTKNLRACLVAAKDAAELGEVLSDMETLWPELSPSACKAWEVEGESP